MDFTFKKPTHVVALLGLSGSLLLFIGYPLFSLLYPMQIPSLYTEYMTPFQKITLEASLLFVQLLFVFISFIVVPIIWYSFVNRLSLKGMFARLQLRRAGLGNALLWGFITIVIAFLLTMVIGLLYMYLTKIDPTTLSNIPDLQQFFSVPSLYLLVIIQPFCEEFFFRGFLFEKTTKLGGNLFAVIITSVLFGVSHLSYTYAYAAIIAVILGVLLSIVVLKTKNLYSAIFAHTLINVASLTLFIFGKSFWM
ncbi:MAG: CPBP family intramembrane metalloprotease [Candidatus Thermoplasmatota archaeon]|nr:CPBP family intramembrane metalloprotease [Candidatus Thermoplasmatota archaeon]